MARTGQGQANRSFVRLTRYFVRLKNWVAKVLKVQTVFDDAFQPSSQPSTFTIISKFVVCGLFRIYGKKFYQNHKENVSAITKTQKFHACILYLCGSLELFQSR